MYLENQKGTVDLLIWEVEPSKRNQNNVIEFYCDENYEIQKSDVIIGNYNMDSFSSYEVTEVLEKRDCKMNGKKHYTCKTEWKNRPISELRGKDLSRISISLSNLIK